MTKMISIRPYNNDTKAAAVPGLLQNFGVESYLLTSLLQHLGRQQLLLPLVLAWSSKVGETFWHRRLRIPSRHGE
jgi:hypothetical protein